MSWKRQALSEGAADSGSMEAEPCTGVDALPDELLLLIFSKLQDGPTLLDTLPLVCRRWRRVARDPAAWAAVELTVKNNVADETRILLHAPAAKALTLDPWLAGYPLPGHRVRSALRRTRLVVRSLAILEAGRSHAEEGLQAAVASFLLRQRDALRDLRLHLSRHDWWDALHAGPTLHALAQLHRLRKLELVTAYVLAYDGDLRPGLPELRELTVRSLVPRCIFARAVPQGLVGDLVRGAPTLRVLDLDMPVAEGDREACAALLALEHLSLNAFQDEQGWPLPRGKDAVRAVRTAFQLVEAVKTPALRTATVSLCRGEHPRYPLRVQRRCKVVQNKFASRSPSVRMYLEMDGPACSQCSLFPSSCPGYKRWRHEDYSDPDSTLEEGYDSDRKVSCLFRQSSSDSDP